MYLFTKIKTYNYRYTLSRRDMVRALTVAWCIPLTITVAVAVEHKLWIAWLIAIYFLVCVLLMVCSCIGMIVTLHKHTSSHDAAAEEMSEMAMKAIADQKRAVRTTLIIIVACVVMNVPPMLVLFARRFRTFSTLNCAVTFFTLLGNSAVNPIIYCAQISAVRINVLECLHIRRIRRNDDEMEYYLTVADQQDL